MTDVVIVGGGPAGLTLGCYLVGAGVPCLVLERVHHPRPHVGESLMPATIRILREIGFHEVVEASDFPRSGGVVYHAKGADSFPVSYGEFPQEGVDQAYTYHVDRAKFDVLLLKHAETLGCKIVQGAAVQRVLFDVAGAATGVLASVGGEPLEIPARVVVDAGGRGTLIGRQLQLRREHGVLDQFALHAWLLDVDRGARRTEDYTHIYFLPDVGGWAWQAPISEDITSVGIVAAKQAFKRSGLDVDGFFVSSFQYNPALARAMAHARLLNHISGDANFGYRLDRVCGDGWLAIGDAARFLDPVFSSGVSVAMHTAREASERIRVAVESGSFGRETFLPYEDHVLAGAAIWDDFIRLFYRLLPSFTYLLDHPEHRTAILRMIQGDVHAESDAGVLGEMRSLVRAVEEADEHPWKGELLEILPG